MSSATCNVFSFVILGRKLREKLPRVTWPLHPLSVCFTDVLLLFHSYELAPSVEAVKESCNLNHREVPNTVIASGFSGRVANQEEAPRKVKRVTRNASRTGVTISKRVSHE